MKRHSRQNPKIRDFILRNVEKQPGGITAITAKEFGISRAAISKYVQRLILEGFLTAEGNTKARRYTLAKLVDETFTIDVSIHLEEHIVWQYRILPLMKNLPQNIIDICRYGFTEMLNNVIDHSASFDAVISYEQTYNEVNLTIIDHGVGIFEKIQRDFNLSDPRSALLELSKGRLTSDPARHSGEGIVFTSRMFDKFSIMSETLFYTREHQEGDDWLIESGDRENNRKGTFVRMAISTDTSWTWREIFKKYENDLHGFRKTHVPIKLSKYPGEQLISRSQAKRILARFDNFSEILLDFKDVQQIGQPFADEIFRVFKNEHPGTSIFAINTTPEIQQMIKHVQMAG